MDGQTACGPFAPRRRGESSITIVHAVVDGNLVWLEMAGCTRGKLVELMVWDLGDAASRRLFQDHEAVVQVLQKIPLRS